MKRNIKYFMLDNFHEHLDDSGCLNMTSLAEDAATEFGDNDANEDIPERYFETAFAVQEQLRREGLINR